MTNPTLARLYLRLERAKTVIMHEPQDGLPTIAPSVALVVSALYTIAYVLPFYWSPALRISATVSRNSHESIAARCHAVFLTCVLCFAITINIHSVIGPATPGEFLHRMGLYPAYLSDTLRTLMLVFLLFAGPLFEQGVVEGGWRHWFRWRSVRAEMWDDWVGFRNLVVGPLSEEWMFRSMNVSLFLAAWMPGRAIVVQAPLVFGIAHLHHLNEFIITHKRPDQPYLSALKTPAIMIPGVARTLFQLAYTTLFGMFATFVFLRTGNVYSCILVHTFCNWMGLPRFWGRLGESVVQTTTIPRRHQDGIEMNDLNADSSAMEDIPLSTSTAHTWSLGIQWTIAYYSLLFIGSVAFYKLLYPWTESNNALTWL